MMLPPRLMAEGSPRVPSGAAGRCGFLRSTGRRGGPASAAAASPHRLLHATDQLRPAGVSGCPERGSLATCWRERAGDGVERPRSPGSPGRRASVDDPSPSSSSVELVPGGGSSLLPARPRPRGWGTAELGELGWGRGGGVGRRPAPPLGRVVVDPAGVVVGRAAAAGALAGRDGPAVGGVRVWMRGVSELRQQGAGHAWCTGPVAPCTTGLTPRGRARWPRRGRRPRWGGTAPGSRPGRRGRAAPRTSGLRRSATPGPRR